MANLIKTMKLFNKFYNKSNKKKKSGEIKLPPSVKTYLNQKKDKNIPIMTFKLIICLYVKEWQLIQTSANINLQEYKTSTQMLSYFQVTPKHPMFNKESQVIVGSYVPQLLWLNNVQNLLKNIFSKELDKLTTKDFML